MEIPGQISAEIDNQIFGRAFISPSLYFSPDNGWVTVSGLRAARLRNVEGVLLGEAVTAARDAAQPLATKEALARWASKQAELIVALVKDEERQARSAEVVLECGGEIGNLKLVKFGNKWLTASELEDRLRLMTEIAITIDGDFAYDEDIDDVLPREFREYFEINGDVIVVHKHDGRIVTVCNSSWPRSILGQPKNKVSNLAEHIDGLIGRAWNDDGQSHEEDRVVGKVLDFNITRRVWVIIRHATGSSAAEEDLPF
jgi:hypothetical protein